MINIIVFIYFLGANANIYPDVDIRISAALGCPEKVTVLVVEVAPVSNDSI